MNGVKKAKGSKVSEQDIAGLIKKGQKSVESASDACTAAVKLINAAKPKAKTRQRLRRLSRLVC